MDLFQLESFLGWCLVINVGILFLSGLILTLCRMPIMHFHSRLMGVSKEGLAAIYLQYIAIYKIAIVLFNFTPYIALKLM